MASYVAPTTFTSAEDEGGGRGSDLIVGSRRPVRKFWVKVEIAEKNAEGDGHAREGMG